MSFLADIPTPVWAGLSGVVSGISTWVLGMRRMAASIERARIKLKADASTDETAERAAFRATLMADIAALRVVLKECDAERDILRSRVHAAEGQILVLRASNEIMEEWVAFFKERNALDTHSFAGAARSDETAGSNR
jgi:hypothetical protein